jgi:3-dehydroquinate synthase
MQAKHTVHEIPVGLGDRSYTISVGSGILDQVGDMARAQGFASPVPIITDDTVKEIYGERIRASLEKAGYVTDILSFPAGEVSKTLDTVSTLYDGMVRLKPERKSGLIALGGGVPGDIAGFVAATYLRGIPFIQVPTTLLAQVDSSVGGKVGVDHPGGKNLIGAFHQPRHVLIDPSTLQTLDPRQVKAGLAEVIKHGVIQDASLFERVQNDLTRLLEVDETCYSEIVPWNCRIKARVVEQDERESGLRAILNFGHTMGHAIEALTGYEHYLHGEAVALGMILEAELGCRLGITPPEVAEAITDLLSLAAYPLEKPNLTCEALLGSMYRDKKVQQGQLHFVFPTDIGEVVVRPVDDQEAIRDVWERYSL